MTDPFLAEVIPSEKVILCDLPLNYTNDMIMSYLNTHPDLVMRSYMMSNTILADNNVETEFLGGDRYVSVHTYLSPVFPNEVVLGDATCKM